MPNPRPARTRLVSLLAFIVVASLSAGAWGETKPKRIDVGGATPTSILWVGNSFFYYNSSMHNHVSNLVRAADPKSTPRATSAGIDAGTAKFLQDTAMETVQEYFGS